MVHIKKKILIKELVGEVNCKFLSFVKYHVNVWLLKTKLHLRFQVRILGFMGCGTKSTRDTWSHSSLRKSDVTNLPATVNEFSN